MPARSKVDSLPEAVRRWLDQALTESNFSGYRELEALLREKGYSIGRSQIARYGQKVQRRFAAIREATEIARVITEGNADDQDKRGEAIIATIQADILSALIDVREADNEELSATERASLLAKVGKSIATLTRSSVSLKKFQADVRAKLDEKMKSLEQQATGGDGRLSLETLKLVREQIYGII